MKLFIYTLSLVCLGLPALSAQAAGDAQRGFQLATDCMGCHGIPSYTNAYPDYRVPRLGGQHADYIVAALKEYQSGNRKHPTMHAQASTMSEQDMQDLAAYFSTFPANK
jgi:cytochrome c553